MAKLGGLIHVFSIIETRILEKFTVYKIQMISFPRNKNLFHCLTKINVQKRYSEFKKLEDDIQKVYKSYNFKSFFKSNTHYFNRFDPEVIEQRKKIIIEFLYYCAENPIIYRSQCFVTFFEDTIIRIDSPIFEENTVKSESLEESSKAFVKTQIKCAEVEESIVKSLDNDMDYLYDAAILFSQAVQAEANLMYRNAFELYKSGIDNLLTGAKYDSNDIRKSIAKTKASKYLEKAEQLYENHLLKQEENDILLKNYEHHKFQNTSFLERPYNNMSKFKVIQIADHRILKVQDRTDKKIYVIKIIWKRHLQKIILISKTIPFMVDLLNYFQSDTAIFLLFPYVTGGLLWNYINTYSLNDKPKQKVEKPLFEQIDEKHFENFLETIQNIEKVDWKILNTNDNYEQHDNEVAMLRNQEIEVSSLETSITDYDVNDLMESSKKLLKSVTKTLEKSVVISTELREKNGNQNFRNESDNMRKIVDESSLLKKLNYVTDILPIQKIDFVLPELILKRWACEIIICVNVLHKNGIILGDLNLDNILLGSNGNINITYFYQKNISDFQNLCHLNPKAINCMYVSYEFPLTKSSDYYSVGVILYEIFTKKRFYLQHPGGISRYNEVQYPDDINYSSLSDEAKDLINSLIFKNNKERPTYSELKAHAFFVNNDFNEIEKNAQL